MVQLIVVGSVALDTVETPYGRVEEKVGGSATYFSMSSSYFSRVGLVGVVGPDFPRQCTDMLNKRSVDLSGLAILNEGETFRWSGRYVGDMNSAQTLETHLNVFADFDPEIPPSYRQTPFVFLANIDPELQLKVLDQVQSPRFVACDTMNYWIAGKPDALEQLLKKVDALFVNDGEARQLTGRYNVFKAIAEIHRMGPRVVVVKRGEYGALLSCDGSYFCSPAFPLEDVRDPTGAGDSFAGGFMGLLAHCDTVDLDRLKQAVIAGTLMASFCVERFGPDRFEDLRHDEIYERERVIKTLIDFPPLETLT